MHFDYNQEVGEGGVASTSNNNDRRCTAGSMQIVDENGVGCVLESGAGLGIAYCDVTKEKKEKRRSKQQPAQKEMHKKGEGAMTVDVGALEGMKALEAAIIREV